MARSYHTLNSQTSSSEEKLTAFLKRKGQQLLPVVDLITQSRVASNELIDSVGRAMLETILEVSAQQVAGARQPGKVRPEAVLWYGRQPGRVYLGDRKLGVERPRLRRRGRGRQKEVAVPAYAALQNRTAMQKRMLDIVMNGVSTRPYQPVIPEMAESVGISKSSVSRETVEASEAALKELLERRPTNRENKSQRTGRRSAARLQDWRHSRPEVYGVGRETLEASLEAVLRRFPSCSGKH